MSTGVYCWFNTANGKRYVGSASTSLEKRKKFYLHRLRNGHCHNRKLLNAWRKYGEKAFRFVVLEVCPPDLCLAKEQEWMDKFDSVKCGYNISPTAGSSRGSKWSLKARRKHSKLRKQLCSSSTVRGNLLKAAKLGASVKAVKSKGVARTAAEKAAISLGTAKAMAREDVRMRVAAGQAKRISNPNLGPKVSEGLRRTYARNPELLKRLRKIRSSAKYRAKLSRSSKAMWERKDIQEKMSRCAFERWADPTFRKKASQAMRKPKSEEGCRNMSRVKKALWADPVWKAKVLAKRRLNRAVKGGDIDEAVVAKVQA